MNNKIRLIGLSMAAAVIASACARKSPAPEPGHLTILAGSYAAAGDTSVRLLHFDTAKAELKIVESVTAPRSASYFTEGPNGIVYGVSEGEAPESRVWALCVNDSAAPSERIKLLDIEGVGSAAPCYIALSPDGRFAVTSNYNGATATVFPIDTDGLVKAPVQTLQFEGSGPVEGRQDTSHPHCIAFTPDGSYMLVNDLGTDRIMMFDVVTGIPDSLVNVSSRRDVRLLPGSGPRHIVFDRQGRNAYLINELSDSVTVLTYDGTTLTPRQYIAANTERARGAADIHLSPDGRYLYASLRLAADGIASFAVDPESGDLTYLGHTPTGAHPRNFLITPDGRYLLVASRDDSRIEVLRRDAATGALTQASVLENVPGVVCLKVIE